MTRPEIKNRKPDATPQEMMFLLNTEWAKEKEAGRKSFWDSRAAQENNPEVVETAEPTESGSVSRRESSSDFHEIRRCVLCGVMIANLKAHLLLAHKLDEGRGRVDDSIQIPHANNTDPADIPELGPAVGSQPGAYL